MPNSLANSAGNVLCWLAMGPEIEFDEPPLTAPNRKIRKAGWPACPAGMNRASPGRPSGRSRATRARSWSPRNRSSIGPSRPARRRSDTSVLNTPVVSNYRAGCAVDPDVQRWDARLRQIYNGARIDRDDPDCEDNSTVIQRQRVSVGHRLVAESAGVLVKCRIHLIDPMPLTVCDLVPVCRQVDGVAPDRIQVGLPDRGRRRDRGRG